MRRMQPAPGPTEVTQGFTLLELLVVVSIITVLAGLVGASLNKLRSAGRSVVCMSNLKSVSQEFLCFADDNVHSYRGDSERYGKNAFRLEDFQEKIYRIDEFWDGGGATEVPYKVSDLLLWCPAAPADLSKQKNLSCSQFAVGPTQNVGMGFNMRLDQISTVVQGVARLQRTRLTSRILEQAQVPLAFDVDGARASSQGVLPYYAAPPAGDAGPYGTGQFWFPSHRHREGKLNVAFIGGYVLSSADPGATAPWFWKYQPPLR